MIERLLCERKIEYKTNILLSNCSSFKIGGECKIGVFPKNREELSFAIKSARELSLKYTVVGRGSNILFSDEGYDGVIIFTSKMNNITEEDGLIYAEAGATLSTLANHALKVSLSGLEFAYGIPGSLGGAVFMNAGAYGGEMSDVVVFSDYYDPDTDTFGRFSGDEQKFSYRESIYSHNEKLVVLAAALGLKEGNADEIKRVMNENMQKRRDKQPLEYPSAGSAFKRPAIGFAAQMIDECGLKGESVGDAAVSEKHAGFVINKGNASAEDVKSLMERVQKCVFEKYGVMLESEIRYID